MARCRKGDGTWLRERHLMNIKGPEEKEKEVDEMVL